MLQELVVPFAFSIFEFALALFMLLLITPPHSACSVKATLNHSHWKPGFHLDLLSKLIPVTVRAFRVVFLRQSRQSHMQYVFLAVNLSKTESFGFVTAWCAGTRTVLTTSVFLHYILEMILMELTHLKVGTQFIPPVNGVGFLARFLANPVFSGSCWTCDLRLLSSLRLLLYSFYANVQTVKLFIPTC